MKRFLLTILVLWMVPGCTPQAQAPLDGAAAVYKAAVSGRWATIWYIVGRHTYPDVCLSIRGGADG